MIVVSGHPLPKMEEDADASWDRVSVNFLQNWGIPIVRGRYFTEADNETAENVAIVNEAFVKRFFKSGEDPMDKHFGMDLPENANTYRIVGVVGDAKFAGWGLRKPARPMFYVPLVQNVKYANELMTKTEVRSHYIGGIMLVTNVAPGKLEPLVTQALAEVDPNLTMVSVMTMRELVERTFDQQRAVASRGAAAGGNWFVWRDSVHRGPADARDWNPHGAWRGTHQGGAACAGRRVDACPWRIAARSTAGHWRWAADFEPALRRFELGSARAGSGGERAGGIGVCGRRDSSDQSGLDFADDRVTQRVGRSKPRNRDQKKDSALRRN
jgi:hypothetical protein